MGIVGSTRELWLVEYEKHAYTDQTGKPHNGHVVYEQTIIGDIRQTGSREHPYSGNRDLPVYEAEDSHGRIFNGYTNWDSGAVNWIERDPPPTRRQGLHWIKVPSLQWGYVQAFSREPVKLLLEEKT